MALVVPGAAAMGAEDQVDASFCGAISIDELNAIGPLQFEPLEFSAVKLCDFKSTSRPDSYELRIGISGLVGFDQLPGIFPDTAEVMVGERPALFADGSLYVDVGLDDGLLVVFTSGFEDAAGVDPVAYSIAIAEIAVAALASTGAGDDGEAAEVTLASPPDIEGMEWSEGTTSSGQDLMNDEAQAAIYQPLLDATGAEPSQLSQFYATLFDDERQRQGQYSAMQVTGTDAAVFRAALLDWLVSAIGDDAAPEDVSIAGKDVVKINLGGESNYLYFDGDTAYALTMPEELAARVIEALP